jgi:hypothetical protein
MGAGVTSPFLGPSNLKEYMKETSKQSYKECKESGYMTAKQTEVYNILKACGPLTANEINKTTKSTSNHKRLSELEDKGLVMDCGYRKDEATGKMVMLWSIAPDGYVPHQEAEKPTKATLEALKDRYEYTRRLSKAYDLGYKTAMPIYYLEGWTACVNSLKGAVPASRIIPPFREWE